MKAAKPEAWFDTDLLVEQSPDPLIRVQRIGLSAGAVEGEHEQLAQPFSQRMFVDQASSAAVSWHRRALVAELESDSFVST